jgi:hypothetical protein
MASGSPSVINITYAILKYIHTNGFLNLTLEQIRTQFETEYRVKTENGVASAGPFTSPTHQELTEEGTFHQLRLATAIVSE